MNTDPAIRALAERIINLISRRARTGVEEALALLRERYPHNHHKVATIYEMACMVYMKRSLLYAPAKKELPISPEADWLALSASQAIARREIEKGFCLLNQAVESGARHTLARSVVFQLLRCVADRQRLQELYYTDLDVTSIEVGRIVGTGLVILKSASCPIITKDWENFNYFPSEPKIILRTESQILRDAQNGAIPYQAAEAHDAPLKQIDWTHYVAQLSSAPGALLGISNVINLQNAA